MRRLTLLALLAFGLAACGGSGGSNGTIKITFGTSGGTMVPSSTTIAADGSVTRTGGMQTVPQSITSTEDAHLSQLVRNAFAHIKSESCPGTFPDESAMFITALGRTVTVRGTCEQGFTKLYTALSSAIGLTHGTP